MEPWVQEVAPWRTRRARIMRSSSGKLAFHANKTLAILGRSALSWNLCVMWVHKWTYLSRQLA
ncbi:MAG: hypothetical protein NVS9B15_01630 [Acidobacteriaceae bacterium]